MSKLPFPCCGVGITLGMSRLSGPKVGSQHTLICSRRNKVQAGREVTLRIGGCPCNAICSALLTAHGLGEAALLVPPDEPSPALQGTRGWREGFPYSSCGWTDCHVPGNRYTGTAKCLAYHLSWVFKWYRKALCVIPGCLMDLHGGKSMPLIQEQWSVFSLPLSTDQSLQAAAVSFTVQMTISSAYIF